MAQQRRRSPQRRRTRRAAKPKQPLFDFKLKKNEFKPDSQGSGIWKQFHWTQFQKLTYLRWGLYVALMVVLLVIQDVIMSRVSIFGATTDLMACVILLITVLEGVEVGSVFVLISSCMYYFSGSSPGPYSVALLTILGIGACMFRQMYWHRNASSIILCSGLGLMLYELGTFLIGIFLELTHWGRLMNFVMTGVLSCIVMIPLYSLVYKIGLIGGNTWKE